MPPRCRGSPRSACAPIGVFPAPEMPDLASMTIAPVEQRRPSAAARAPAARPSDSSQGSRRGARRQSPSAAVRTGHRRFPSGSEAVAGYHRCRSASPRMRNAPERSMTRTPRSSSVGASSADAASGNARKTTSASAARRSTSSGDDRAVADPCQGGQRPRRAGGARRHGRGERDAGWRARMRTSSCPAKPVAPAMATAARVGVRGAGLAVTGEVGRRSRAVRCVRHGQRLSSGRRERLFIQCVHNQSRRGVCS